jgi:hypothetical protein
MTVSTNLAVQPHQQDTDYYCGAACAQMVLETIVAGILDQDDLYADNHSHSTIESGWASGPDGLQWTMNDRRPPTFSNYFALFALDTEEAISRKICWTIHHYQVAPIALVYGWAHWIAIRGYSTSAHPASSADNTYTIEAFDVNNPWPPTPSFDDPTKAPPPPHSAGDGCGAGGDRGVANEHITYGTWQSTYMTGVPGGYWNGKFVAVCDPEPPAERGGPRVQQPRRRRGNDLITSAAAAEAAVAGFKRFGLAERKDWAALLAKAKPAEAVTVQRLDRPHEFYSIVPFRIARGTAAVAAVNARWGDYQQAALLPKLRGDLYGLNREAALKLVVGKRIDLGNDLGRFLVRSGAVCLYPYLVWRPCRESLSPYYPFHMLTIGRHRLYVRIDGEIFTSLTLNMKGI